ncbi:Retrotransposon protein [Phytophthora palmivora]|uniref:Retrotransposon protein n=1 Tax=Phytophthora palmivora TaxID=4796 RepID=A0A2P4XH37_9STRA|nr:Retrotransposon protein [Phytophthora palmivora]
MFVDKIMYEVIHCHDGELDWLLQHHLPECTHLCQGDIEKEQRRELAERDLTGTPPTCSWNTVINLYVTDSGKVWIPSNSVDLQQRLCVVAHACLSGHLGAGTTERMLAEKFEWPTLRDDIRKFVGRCLHCMVVGDQVIPHPFGEALHASAPNEVLHLTSYR